MGHQPSPSNRPSLYWLYELSEKPGFSERTGRSFDSLLSTQACQEHTLLWYTRWHSTRFHGLQILLCEHGFSLKARVLWERVDVSISCKLKARGLILFGPAGMSCTWRRLALGWVVGVGSKVKVGIFYGDPCGWVLIEGLRIAWHPLYPEAQRLRDEVRNKNISWLEKSALVGPAFRWEEETPGVYDGQGGQPECRSHHFTALTAVSFWVFFGF